jgi:DNA-binding transcriptional ArsR family regulator
MDKRQGRIWAENRENLLGIMGDYQPRTVSQLAKRSGLTRASVYNHLHRLTSGEIVSKETSMVISEGSKYRLNPECVYDEFKPRWHLTEYNRIVLPNGISAEVELDALRYRSSFQLPADVQNRLQILGNMLLAQKLLRAAGL